MEDQEFFDRLDAPLVQAAAQIAADAHEMDILEELREAAALPGYGARIRGRQCVHPHCGRMVEHTEQRGRYMYGLPCGCAQWRT